MADDDLPPVSLAAIASRYETVITWIPLPTGAWQVILKANPQRWWVQFWGGNGSTSCPFLLPGSPPENLISPGAVPAPLEYKFRDSPSVVTGEFWGWDSALTGWLIIEQVYRG